MLMNMLLSQASVCQVSSIENDFKKILREIQTNVQKVVLIGVHCECKGVLKA